MNVACDSFGCHEIATFELFMQWTVADFITVYGCPWHAPSLAMMLGLRSVDGVMPMEGRVKHIEVDPSDPVIE